MVSLCVAVYGVSLSSPLVVSIRRGLLCQGWARVGNIQVWIFLLGNWSSWGLIPLVDVFLIGFFSSFLLL
jgi:hypothetical protein